MLSLISTFFFFNDTATTEIYTLSLHDALPIWEGADEVASQRPALPRVVIMVRPICDLALWSNRRFVSVAVKSERKNTPLKSSHSQNSYAAFCFKKKKNPKSPSFAEK